MHKPHLYLRLRLYFSLRAEEMMSQGEVMHLRGLSHQVNPIPIALTFSSLFLCKEQADPSATRSSTEHILAIVFSKKSSIKS